MRYTDIAEVKKKLRSEFKSIRRGFAPEDQQRRDRQICSACLHCLNIGKHRWC